MYYFLKKEDKEEWVTAPALHTRRENKASGTKYILNQFYDANSFPLGSVCSLIHHSFTYRVLTPSLPAPFQPSTHWRRGHPMTQGKVAGHCPAHWRLKQKEVKHSVPRREMEQPTRVRSQVPGPNCPDSHSSPWLQRRMALGRSRPLHGPP